MHHLLGEDGYDEDIRQGLEEKLDAILNRIIYSEYKTAPTEELREKARQEYLTAEACRKATAGLFRLGNCDRRACHALVPGGQNK